MVKEGGVIMTTVRHGISVGIERTGNDFYMTFTAVGKLTHADYEMITPMIDSALEGIKEPAIKMLVDVTYFEGWELKAAWDDFKIGLKHGNKFVRVAMYGNKPWQEWMGKIAGWFISGEVKYFEDEKVAIEWLQS